MNDVLHAVLAAGLFDRALVRALPAFPRSVVRRVSSRYIAGASLDDAVRVVRELNAGGYRGPLSVEWEDSGMEREYGAMLRLVKPWKLRYHTSSKPNCSGRLDGGAAC